MHPSTHPATTTIHVVYVDHDNPLYADDEESMLAWLPTIGPTAAVLARWLIAHDGDHSTGDIAQQLGVGVPRLHHALHRLSRAGLITIDDETHPTTVTVLVRWPHPRRRPS
jgi:hypothetical protein